MSEITEQQVQPGTGEKLAAGGGLASAIAGLIGASCCVLPIILFKIGVGSAVIGNLIFFADKTEYFLIGALLFITPGVIVSFWGGRRPGKRAILMFGLSAFIVLLAYILPSFEGDILRLLGRRLLRFLFVRNHFLSSHSGSPSQWRFGLLLDGLHLQQ